MHLPLSSNRSLWRQELCLAALHAQTVFPPVSHRQQDVGSHLMSECMTCTKPTCDMTLFWLFPPTAMYVWQTVGADSWGRRWNHPCHEGSGPWPELETDVLHQKVAAPQEEAKFRKPGRQSMIGTLKHSCCVHISSVSKSFLLCPNLFCFLSLKTRRNCWFQKSSEKHKVLTHRCSNPTLQGLAWTTVLLVKVKVKSRLHKSCKTGSPPAISSPSLTPEVSWCLSYHTPNKWLPVDSFLLHIYFI